MKLHSHKEQQLLHNIVQKAMVDVKREKLLAANKAAARALLGEISVVSYVTQRKNESTD